jgi:thiol reductant ABC exporter CydC subunit
MGLLRDLTTPPLLRAGVLGGLATTAGVALTATSGWLIVQASTMPAILTLLVAIVCVRTFGIARPVLRYAERLRSHDAALATLAQRRVITYARLVPLTPARLGQRSRSDVLTSAVRDLDDVVDAQVRVIVPVMAALTAAGLAIVATAVLLPAAGVVVAAVVAVMVMSGAVALRAEATSQEHGLQARAEASRVGALVTAQALEIQAVGGQPAALSWLARAHAGVAQAAVRAGWIRGTGALVQAMTTAVSTAGMALVVAPFVGHSVSRPVAALLVLTPLALSDATTTIPDAIGAWARARAASLRLGDLLDQEPAVRGDAVPVPEESPGAAEPADSAPAGAEGLVDPSPAEVRTEQLVLRWHPSRPSLAAMSLHVGPGEHVAITGPNGSGKSTLLAALARHLDPESGRYLLDGLDAVAEPLTDIRSRIAVVDDEPHLFASSLRENLRLARPGRPDEDLLRALDHAGLTDWYAGLPDGLDTRLGSGGRGVSGGERARLAMARALLSGRPLLLLDEPVAHLDHATATQVLRDLRARSTDRTVIMVSHRGDALDTVDRVIDVGDLH